MVKPKMILAVDDDPNLVMFFKEFFKQEGYNSLCTDDPEKAIRISTVVHPDLLIMDLRMPKIDGFGLLARIRESTPEIKTILISAYTDGVEDKIKEARIEAVLKKPVQFEDLEQWILKLLDVTKEEVQDKAIGLTQASVKILFVDDDQEILDAVGDAFSGYGFQMDTAKSGSEGLEKMKQAAYDILVTDHSMGNMSGLDLIQKLQTEVSQKPAVMAVCSTMMSKDLELKYRGLGVQSFLLKPIRFDAMIRWFEAKIPEIQKKK